ncbi:MAG: hypothetical protein AAFV53_33950 [Myxococcota bacterium]
MSLMKESLQKEFKMLRACGAKAQNDEDGFWFWFTRVEEARVLVMRPRARDPEGAKIKGAIARARQAVKKATRKSPRRFVTGEAYYEKGCLHFYGDSAFPKFRDEIRAFAKDNKLKFLIGAKLHTSSRAETEISEEEHPYNMKDVETYNFISDFPDDSPDFDVDAFLEEEVGAVQKVKVQMNALMMDASDLLLTPVEIADQVRRANERARLRQESVDTLDIEIESLRQLQPRSPEQDATLLEKVAYREKRMRERDSLLKRADWLDAALPAEGEEVDEYIALSELSDAERKDRVRLLKADLVELKAEQVKRQKDIREADETLKKRNATFDETLADFQQRLAASGQSSVFLDDFRQAYTPQDSPEDDIAKIQTSLAGKEAEYEALKKNDLSEMSPKQSHALLKQKLALSAEMESLRARLKNRTAFAEMLQIEQDRYLDGKLEKTLRRELSSMGLLETVEAEAFLKTIGDLQQARERTRKEHEMALQNETRIQETEREVARAELFDDTLKKGDILANRLTELFQKDHALSKLNPEKPKDLQKLRKKLGDAAVNKLLRRRRILWKKRKKLQQLGASFADQKAIFEGMPDDWLPLQLRESEKLFREVTDFIEQETGKTLPTKTEVRAEHADRKLSSTGKGNQMIDKIDPTLSVKQQKMMMKFTSQLVAIAVPLAEVSGLSDAIADLTSDVTESINEAFASFTDSVDGLSEVIDAIQEISEVGQEIADIIHQTGKIVDGLKAAATELRDLHGRLADSPEHGHIADDALEMLEKISRALKIAETILTIPNQFKAAADDPTRSAGLFSSVSSDFSEIKEELSTADAFVKANRHLLKEVGGEVKALNGLDPVEQMMMMEELTESLIGLAQANVELTAGLLTTVLGQIPGLGIAVNGLAFLNQMRQFAENMSRAVVNSNLHQEAADELSVLEPTLDMIQDRDKRLAARRATEGAISVLRIAADACTLSGVGAIATPALKGIAEGVNAIKSVAIQVDEITTAQNAKDELQRAADGDALSRKEIFRDDPRYAIGAIAVMSKQEPPNEFAVRCLKNFGISETMLKKSSASVIRRYLKMKLKVDDDPTTWDDVVELTVKSAKIIGEGSVILMTLTQRMQLIVVNQFVEDSPSQWPDAIDKLQLSARELGTHISIVPEYRLANARLWDAIARIEDLDDRAKQRFTTLNEDLKRRKKDIDALRQQLLDVSQKLCDMQDKMQKGPKSFGEGFALMMESNLSLARNALMDPLKAIKHGDMVWLQERAEQMQVAIEELNDVADRMAA